MPFKHAANGKGKINGSGIHGTWRGLVSGLIGIIRRSGIAVVERGMNGHFRGVVNSDQ